MGKGSRVDISCGVGHRYGLDPILFVAVAGAGVGRRSFDSTPSLGTSIYHRCGPKKHTHAHTHTHTKIQGKIYGIGVKFDFITIKTEYQDFDSISRSLQFRDFEKASTGYG